MRNVEKLAVSVLLAVASPALAEDWNAHFGGIPNDNLVTGEIGYSAVPKVGFHHAVSPSMTVGGAFAFDLGYYAPEGGTRFGIGLTAPIRIGLGNSGPWSMGLKLEPGLLIQFEGRTDLALLLNGGFNAGYRVNNQFIVGPGIDVLLGFNLTNQFFMALPILMGGALEFQPRPDIALTFDLKMGPWIQAGEFSDVGFGLKVAAGVAYKF